MNDWQGLTEFVAIARHGSISAAAEALNTPRTTVSRRLKELEESLGVTLAHRTTRTLKLTQAGLLLFERSRAFFELGHSIREEVVRQDGTPQGTLRISVPAGPNPWIIHTLSNFLQHHPNVHVEILGTARAVDLVREGFDAVIRAGQIHDERLVGRKLATSDLICVGTPAYLQKHGHPTSLEDLSNHTCALWASHGKAPNAQWPLYNEDRTILVRGSFASNDIHHLLEYTLTHQALALLPEPIARPYTQAGKLHHILPNILGKTTSIWILYAPTQYQRPVVRALIDHVCTSLPWTDKEFHLFEP